MCLDFIAETILALIIERLFGCTESQFDYFVKYKENIKDFADEVDKLRREKGKVDKRIEDAKDEGKVEVEDNVSTWLTEAHISLTAMEEDLNRLRQGTVNLNCLDVCSRYQLGKEAKEKKLLVTKLIENGSNFGTVAQRPRLINTWQRTYSTKYERVHSREPVFEEIMAALEDDRNYKIGIHGMPGVGKTRTMEEVAKQAKEKGLFDEIAKIVVSQNPILKDIQLKLAASLNMKSVIETKDEDERRELLRIRLKNGKKILVMVDDVWNNQIKLEDIGIPATNDHTKGCKILLTSRIQDVCEAMGVPRTMNFKIGVLSESEAWSLFNKKVGDSIQSHGMRSVAEAVCKECAGLPLAILAVGGALLNKKSKQVWEDALKQLKSSTAENIPGLPAKLYPPIVLSYNHLELVDAKSLFLLCCLFPEDVEIPIEWLVRFGFGMSLLRGVDTMEEARNRTHTLVTILKTSSLLLQGDEEHRVKMHDVIRDVAISIASKDKDVMFLVKAGIKKWSEKDEYKRCRAISLLFNDDCVIPYDLECPELRTLMLLCEDSSEVPCSFLKGMEKLVVLFLDNIHITTLPSSLKNLRMLHLISSQLVNLAYLKEFKKLEILSIQYSALEELAPEIGQLSCLRLLDLRKNGHLKILPSGVISNLSQLEELYISDEFDRWEVEGNASLMELNSLRCLISLEVHVPNVKLLPLNELLFKSLIRFQISIGSKFKYNEIRSPATRILKLVGFPLKRELNILMEKAEVLFLIQLEGLKDVFHNREGEGFLDLKYLEVKKCDGVEHLFGKPKLISQTTRPCTSGSFSQLSVLEVDRCGSSYLFSAATARGLLQLQKLTIRYCEMLEEIISDDQEVMLEEIVGDIEQEVMDTITLHQLKVMELWNLPNLRSFYGNTQKMSTTGCRTSILAEALFNDKVRFPALEKLNIVGLKSLTRICYDELLLSLKGEDSFRRLRKIDVRGCHELVNVVPPNALGLEILKVIRCDSVVCGIEMVAPEEGSVEILVFSRLKTMRLEFLPNFKSFCWSRNNILLQQPALFNHKVAFPALEKLEIENLGSLTAIWDDQLQSLLVKEAKDSFRQLMYMEVFRCEKLVNVIPSNMLPRLHNLEKLKVSQCHSLLYEVEVLGTVEKGYPTTTTPTINILPQLQEMDLSNLPSLVMYIRLNRLCVYSNLTDLHLSNRNSLENVFSPSTTRYLVHLQKLTVENCEKMEEIVAVERGQLGEEDVVHDGDIIVFPQLKVLILDYLPNLKSICCSRGSKKQEDETVEQKNMPRVEALFNHKVRFPALEELQISILKSLTTIWDNELFLSSKCEDSFSQLRAISVHGCHKLVNVVPPNALPLLQGLKNLFVGGCDSVVCGVEMVAPEEDGDEILVFSRLKTMTLEFLPNFKSFCWSRSGGEDRVLEGNNIVVQQQTLFNHKVRFPALEELQLFCLENLLTIWDNELFLSSKCEDSFSQLRAISVQGCHKLVNVVPPNALPLLQGLEILEVRRCDSVVCGVEMVAPEEDGDEILVFSRLKTMTLEFLPNFKSFCWSRSGGEDRVLEGNNILVQQQTLFNHKVRFPALEELQLFRLENLLTIWDNELFLSSKCEDSFSQLRAISVQGCHKLVNVVPPNALPLLQGLEILEVRRCDSVVCGVEMVAPEEDGDEILVFSRLKTMTLEFLPNFKSFCWSRSGGEDRVLEGNNILVQQQTLFNHKVRFPALEELQLFRLENLLTIWDNELFLSSKCEDSFSQLRAISVQGCHKLVNVVPPNALPLLQGLEILEVRRCDSVVCGVEMVAPEEDGDEILVFSRLKTMTLEFLPNFKSFCWSRSGGEDRVLEGNNILVQQQTLFNHKVRFPTLEELNIDKLKSLTAIWDNQLFLGSGAQDSFRQLKLVLVERCEKLVNVIKNEEEGEEDSTNEIVFSQLWRLQLKGLPKLTSFCGANNAAFKFPSLNKVSLVGCPELQTFASGGISTPQDIIVHMGDRFWIPRHVNELNKYVEEQYIGKGKGLQTVDNDDEEEDSTEVPSSSFLY